MSKHELEYGGDKNRTHTVEVLLADVAPDDENGLTGFVGLVDDFSDYLEQAGLEDYWGDCYEIYPFYKHGLFCASLGVKFVFTRLVSHKNKLNSQSMGGGTQWVSDVIDLMKNYLVYMRTVDNSRDTEVYLDARLIFREGDKQFEWR